MPSAPRPRHPPAGRRPPAAAAPVAVPTRPLLDDLFGGFWPDRRRAGAAPRPARRAGGRAAGRRSCCRSATSASARSSCCSPPAAWCSRRRRHRRDPFTLACAGLCVLLAATRVRARRRVDRGAVPAGRGRALRLRRDPRPHAARASCCPGSSWPLAGLRGLPWLGPHPRRAHRPRPGCRAAAHGGAGRSSACSSSARCSPPPTRLFAEWVDALLPDLTVDTFVLRAFVTVAVGGHGARARPTSPSNPPRVGARRPDAAPGRPPVRVAGPGRRRQRACSRRCSSPRPTVIVRRPRLPAAHDRPHLRRVRAPGLRPAHRRHRPDAAGDLGGRPQGPARRRRPTGLAARSRSDCCASRPSWWSPRRSTGCTSTRRPTASPGSGCSSTSSRAGSGLLVLAVLAGGARAAGGVAAAVRPRSPVPSRCSASPRSTPTRGSPSATSTGTPRPARSTGPTSRASPTTPCPTLARLPADEQRLCARRPGRPSDDDWLEWNLGRSRAASALEGARDQASTSCPSTTTTPSP